MVETPEHPPGSTGDAPPRVRKVAAFDFDGTVSRRDTLMPFVARLRRGQEVAHRVPQGRLGMPS
ncbi:MAG: hypothetical protein M5U19_13820 [Microthrixaceae bacterium]|nr:hypothetical protein [Microthrixaceae bacterium]